jgi:hypothetical protein
VDPTTVGRATGSEARNVVHILSAQEPGDDLHPTLREPLIGITLTLTIAGSHVGHYSAEGNLLTPLTKKQIKAVEKTLRGKVQKQTFPLNLQIPHTAGFALSHRLSGHNPILGKIYAQFWGYFRIGGDTPKMSLSVLP